MAALITFIILVSGVGSVFLITKKNKGGSKVSWVKFYTKGKEAGFSNENIKILKELAHHSGMEHPTALFWSQVQMDECIKKFIQSIKQNNTELLPANQEFLAKLYDFRKKMEMERPIYKNGITSSRNIDELQAAQVVILNVGAFKSKIISNKSDHISIERPDDAGLPSNFTWKGRYLSLYFWRKNDAGYCFETKVVDEIQSNNPPLLILEHSDKLLRTQSRKSLRVKTHRIAMLYRVEDRAPASKSEVITGVKCYLEDISDSGCALKAGGTVSAGLRVIVQFVIDSMPLSISGVVRNVDYDKAKNTSLLHIESDLIPISVKNKIFSVMFGMVSNDDTSIPHPAGISGTMPQIADSAANVSHGNNKIAKEREQITEEYDDSHDFDFFEWDDQSKTEGEDK
jgi:c-di-GMP-binding flagellar brake protein YcgR